MGPNYCEKCSVEGYPDPRVGNRWICPVCHGTMIHVEATDSIDLRDAFGMHGASDQIRDGLPTREFAHTVGLYDEASAMEVKRDAAGRSEIQRTMTPTGPSPRDAQGERKRAEELRAVRAVLAEYNRHHGTAYDSIASGEDARGVDVVASSRRPEDPAIDFQLTFVDTEGGLRASIARGEPYSVDGSEEELLDRFARALRKKSLAADPDAILILDGAGVVTTAGTIDRFVRDHRQDLKQAPFREVWYVDHTPGGVVRRLSTANPAPDDMSGH